MVIPWGNGVAVAAGASIAMDAADVVLAGSDLRKLAAYFELSRLRMRTISATSQALASARARRVAVHVSYVHIYIYIHIKSQLF